MFGVVWIRNLVEKIAELAAKIASLPDPDRGPAAKCPMGSKYVSFAWGG
jgi:hypothetical protein